MNKNEVASLIFGALSSLICVCGVGYIVPRYLHLQRRVRVARGLTGPGVVRRARLDLSRVKWRLVHLLLGLVTGLGTLWSLGTHRQFAAVLVGGLAFVGLVASVFAAAVVLTRAELVEEADRKRNA